MIKNNYLSVDCNSKSSITTYEIILYSETQIFYIYFQAVKSKTETVTEEMLDEDLKEDELSDPEEPPVVADVEQEEAQPTNVSNKLVFCFIFQFIF